VASFRLFESFETSSNEPGCGYRDKKKTKMAISQAPMSSIAKMAMYERTVRALSPSKTRIMWPPSSIPMGSRLSIVIIMFM